MAESQVPFEYSNNKEELIKSITEERLSGYLNTAGHDYDYAFSLYLYNARLSKAFLFPLHVVEVTLRNRLSKLFEAKFGSNWPADNGFRSLLTSESLAALDKGIRRANSANINDVVATLTFDFWSNLFRPEYDRDLWQTNMNAVAPMQPVSRHQFQNLVKKINKFRNRIAHYEPIIHSDANKMYTTILDTVNLMCPKTVEWMRHFSTVNMIIRTKPSGKGELPPFFKDRADNQFQSVAVEESLEGFPSNQFIVCYEGGEPRKVLTNKHIVMFLKSKIEAGSELVLDLKELTYGDIIDSGLAQEKIVIVTGSESFSKAATLFKEKGVGFILVKQESNLIGVVQKAHRRY